MRISAAIVLIAFGIVARWAGIMIGHADDAPGAGAIGIAILLGTLFGGYIITRKQVPS